MNCSRCSGRDANCNVCHELEPLSEDEQKADDARYRRMELERNQQQKPMKTLEQAEAQNLSHIKDMTDAGLIYSIQEIKSERFLGTWGETRRAALEGELASRKASGRVVA